MRMTKQVWLRLRRDPAFCTELPALFREMRGEEHQVSLAGAGAVHTRMLQRMEQGDLEDLSFNAFTRLAAAVQRTPESLVTEVLARCPSLAPLMEAEDVDANAGVALVGRNDACELAIKDLRTNAGLFLYGAPGQGKTALARFVANVYAARTRTEVVEIYLESERQVENLPRLVATAVDDDAVANYDSLRDRGIVLILDGIDQLVLDTPTEKLRDALNALMRALTRDARVIVTCQMKLEKQGFSTREVGPLAEVDAFALFQMVAGDTYAAEPPQAVAAFVARSLSGHPLSIKIVASYGRATQLPLADLQRLWQEKWEAIAAKAPASLDDRGLLASFELSFSALGHDSRLMFLTLGLLPDGIVPPIVRAVWSDAETKMYEAIQVLRDRSLLEDAPNAVRRNRLRGPLFLYSQVKKMAQIFAGDALIDEIERASGEIDKYFDQYVLVNAPQFSDADQEENNGLIRQQFHNIHASLDRRLDPSTGASTLAAAHSVLKLYWAYHNNLSGDQTAISSTEDAIAYLEKAHAVFVGNDRQEEATRCLYYIGNIHWLRGDVARAQAYFQDASGSNLNDERVACEIQRAFAHIEYKEGRISDAVPSYLAVITRAGVTFPECVARCRVGLLDAYRKLEAFDEASSLWRVVEPELDGLPRGIAGNLLRGRAYILASAGELTASLDLYRTALDVFGANDFGQAHCWRGIADVYVKQGRVGEAPSCFARAMELYTDARKVPSLGVSLVMLGRARLLEAEGQMFEALDAYRAEAIQLDREHLNEPYEYAVARSLIGGALSTLSERRKANAEFAISASYFERVGASKIAERMRSRMTPD